MNEAAVVEIETFPNPAPEQEYIIEHIHEEWTSVCPKTGHPDFATITLRYVPGETCVELKSLKLYYQSFRNRGIFYEAVCNELYRTLYAALKPQELQLVGDFRGRGGIHSRVSVGDELGPVR